VQLVAEAAGSLRVRVSERAGAPGRRGARTEGIHPLLSLLENAPGGRRPLLHDIAASLLIGGNAYSLFP
jgi:phage portal protein BeeE